MYMYMYIYMYMYVYMYIYIYVYIYIYHVQRQLTDRNACQSRSGKRQARARRRISATCVGGAAMARATSRRISLGWPRLG